MQPSLRYARVSVRILVIDNYDSFTFNLVQYLGELGATSTVVKNDAIDLAGIAAHAPDGVLVSPGPCTPNEAGISLAAVANVNVPVLGVCLGHQAIGHACGGRIGRAPTPKHGKTSTITHDGRGVFQGLTGPLDVGRYHSLIVADEGWPDALEVAARADDDHVVMALRHKTYPLHGVQFHPESVLTADGRRLLRNFLEHA